jgi:hypothetical protein
VIGIILQGLTWLHRTTLKERCEWSVCMPYVLDGKVQ